MRMMGFEALRASVCERVYLDWHRQPWLTDQKAFGGKRTLVTSLIDAHVSMATSLSRQ